jgi:hypothetical protein
VDVIVYVETNFLMSVAMGREGRGVTSSPPFQRPYASRFRPAAIWSRSRLLKTSRNAETGSEQNLISMQLRRDTTSANAGTLLRRLEESRIANDQLLNDVQARLFQLVDRAAGILESIPETPAIIQRAVTAMLIPDPTDNLILHSILDHAGRFPGATKALLTDNTRDFDTEDVQAALAAAGINRPFRSVTNVLGWLGSFPR